MNSIFAFLFLVILTVVILVAAFVYTLYYNVFPGGSTSKGAMQTIYSNTFGFFDRSFIILVLIMIIGSAICAYVIPNMLMGIFDLIALFLFATIFTAFRTGILSLFNGLSMQTIMPNVYAVLSSNWIALFLMGALAVECVFNFRGRKSQEGEGNNEA